ncbi:MAG: D-glycero-beta-D-manno-heptose 1-phosphate adenylyltransferase [Halanaerobiales bacterium]|nr:D-glycero-beta-D-manno-heptose 1-phosphate adenylyltransferase [Halanaerobiales bacterium]
MREKIYPIAQLKQILQRERKTGKKIVFTNGCFDILHVGHVHYLTAAKKRGDILVIGLNSDRSVKGLKGDKRPLIDETARAEVLSSLEVVDYISIFNESTANQIIADLQPDIYVKGGDYQIGNLPEVSTVASYGGEVQLIPVVTGASTTNIIKEILRRYG